MAHRARIAWDDLRIVLAVSDAGAFASAGRALRMNATTVQRRVDALEARLSVRLFERLASGYVPTAAGERIVAAARSAEEVIAGLDRRLAGLNPNLDGTLRVTTTDTLAASVMPAYLRRFQTLHPALGIDLVSANAMFTLARRDADVALRPVATAPDDLISRRAARVAFAIYGAPKLLAGRRDIPLADLPWVVPDHLIAGIAADVWIRANTAAERVAARASTMTAMAALAEAGLGLTVLPCYLGDLTGGLMRAMPEPIAELSTTLFLVSHPDLATSSRVLAFLDFMAAAIAEDRDLFEGGRVRSETR